MVVDLQATQSPTTRGRGIARYASSWANAVEQLDPEVVSSYLLSPDLPPPGNLDALARSGKVVYRGSPAVVGEPAIFHSLSALDTAIAPSAIWPEAWSGTGVLRSALVYDVIPALAPEDELVSPVDRRRYRLLLELVRGLDAVFTLSPSVAGDLDALGVRPPGGVTVVGAAPDRRFVPPVDRDEAADEVARMLGCAPRYVYVPTGSHPRKNNERIVAAFASLDASVREGTGLVLSGEIDAPTKVHYEAIASGLGAPGSVVVAGYLPDDLHLRCFQGATLVCFGSLAEGFGLPVVEAYASGAPVIASDREPFRAFVDPRARFDPTDVASIAEAMRKGVGGAFDEVGPSAPVDSWDAVARRSIEGFDALVRTRRRLRVTSARARRPRIAFVSPLPPAPTGIAGYSARLIEEILATGAVDLDCYTDGAVTPAPIPGLPTPRNVRALEGVEALCGRYDDVIFTIGNSHHHLGALDVLLRRGGSVLAHDVRLTNLYRHRHGDPGRSPGGLERSLREMYGDALPEGLGRNGEISTAELEVDGVLMARAAIDAATRFFVFSRTAFGLATIDAGRADRGQITALPFGIARPNAAAPFLAEGQRPPTSAPSEALGRWEDRRGRQEGSLVAAFGIVDRSKLPGLLVDAVGSLSARVPDIELAFVGPISQLLTEELADAAARVDLGDRLTITGPLGPGEYRRWMEATTVAVQLRPSSNGEASATIGECLALGIPTIASATGWAAELPEGTVELVDRNLDATELAARLDTVLGDLGIRHSLAESGQKYAADNTFDRAARELLAAVGVPDAAAAQRFS